jgi:hypothetical protein
MTPSTWSIMRRASVSSMTSRSTRASQSSWWDSIHVVHYEKGQRVEHDIEVDQSKPVVLVVRPGSLVMILSLRVIMKQFFLGASGR